MTRLMFSRGVQRHWHSLGPWSSLTLATTLFTCGCKAPGDEGLFGVADPDSEAPTAGAGGAPISPSLPESPMAAGPDSGTPAPVSGTLPMARVMNDAGTNDAATPAQDAGAQADASSLSPSPLCAAPDAGSAPQQPAADASALSSCCGQVVEGLCWYLSPAGQSCTQICSDHGGFDPAGTAIVGSEQQGGSLANCGAVLEALLPDQNAPVGAGTRDDNLGLGCHLFQDSQTLWWLVDVPFNPTASQVVTRLACSCQQ